VSQADGQKVKHLESIPNPNRNLSRKYTGKRRGTTAVFPQSASAGMSAPITARQNQ